ncbi:pentapeptide repeat-containing protein [Alkalihalobacterium bogoriense]|uniref:pentapeptide repeat-containing protein n=1 Tax=Alkalihalobacterium bogoriense TaxID=246272 RepID=UPI00047BEB94|nr:pentapeptide repeat-containing protein [Alkalihalobacterium bogoriense]
MSTRFANPLQADCEQCFGLCCVALPYAKSADFPIDKDSGVPCSHLQTDYRCDIHSTLREKQFKGCTVFECFGAGQKVSQQTYANITWQDNPAIAKEMFQVFPIMHQLHEMLAYLQEALAHKEAYLLFSQLKTMLEKTEQISNLPGLQLLDFDISAHRKKVNPLLLEASVLIREKARKQVSPKNMSRIEKRRDFIGANLQKANLQGLNLRGALFIAANLQKANLREADLIGADFRDTNICGADLRGSLFLTQVQVNAAIGDRETKLPSSLSRPPHWK